MRAHRIDRQVIELHCGSEEKVGMLRPALAHYILPELARVMGKVLDEVSASGEDWYRVDRLEIDLGEMTMEEWTDGREVMRRFEYGVRERVGVWMREMGVGDAVGLDEGIGGRRGVGEVMMANSPPLMGRDLAGKAEGADAEGAGAAGSLDAVKGDVLEVKVKRPERPGKGGKKEKTGRQKWLGGRGRPGSKESGEIREAGGMRESGEARRGGETQGSGETREMRNGGVLSEAGLEWEMVRSFLLSGQLPWWADVKSLPDMDILAGRVAREMPGKVKSWIKESGSVAVWQRVGAFSVETRKIWTELAGDAGLPDAAAVMEELAAILTGGAKAGDEVGGEVKGEVSGDAAGEAGSETTGQVGGEAGETAGKMGSGAVGEARSEAADKKGSKAAGEARSEAAGNRIGLMRAVVRARPAGFFQWLLRLVRTGSEESEESEAVLVELEEVRKRLLERPVLMAVLLLYMPAEAMENEVKKILEEEGGRVKGGRGKIAEEGRIRGEEEKRMVRKGEMGERRRDGGRDRSADGSGGSDGNDPNDGNDLSEGEGELPRRWFTFKAAEQKTLEEIVKKRAAVTKREERLLAKTIKKIPIEDIVVLRRVVGLPEEKLGEMLSGGESDTTIERMLVGNSGLCLFAPYLASFFGKLGYIRQERWVDKRAVSRAVNLLQYVATGRRGAAAGKRGAPEYLLSLNKILCGLLPEEVIGAPVRLTKKEMLEADRMVEAVVANWGALKNTSRDGLRGSFVCREGIVTDEGKRWVLRVERKEYDLLLNSLPWGFSFIKLPWMVKHLEVEW